MVNGNYVLYGDRPSAESETVEDNVQQRSDKKIKRKSNRTANELQHTLNLAQLDNDTDSVKYEKKIMEPRLLRYVPTTEVEENFVTEQFETYDMKPTEERPRRYGFAKKPRNPTDGSVNYGYSAYSRSSSTCSSPNANLPTISEHGEQYGGYRGRPVSSPVVNDIVAGYDTKLDKYFSKPREVKPFAAKGTHPDSLYRVPAETTPKGNNFTRVLRMLRWPVALLAICIALAVFVYFLMPENLDSGLGANGTFWEPLPPPPIAAGIGLRAKPAEAVHKEAKGGEQILGIQPSEIDFYDAENNKNIDLTPVTEQESDLKNILPIPPVFPTHLTPEVQYGNEKADSEKRTPKFLQNDTHDESTLKPHITQKPEKPLAIYFKDASDATTASTETVSKTESENDYTANKQVEEHPVKTHRSAYKEYVPPTPKDHVTQTVQYVYRADEIATELGNLPEVPDVYNRASSNVDVNFTSGHSKLFGISIEDAEKMKSTTQSALYNTRVSPTLPTWRDRDDTTTKKYPNNIYSEVQCKSTRLVLCRGVLPYDLAGAAVRLDDVDLTSLVHQINYLVSTNCSVRVRHFVCALLEPECSPPPYPTKKPCYNLCKAIVDSCDGHIPQELIPVFDCKKYPHNNCVAAKAPCLSPEFTCGDESCIPDNWVCDGRKDCADGDDEQNCEQCDNNEFKCPSGGCIQQRWLCDGYKDCPADEDESEQQCGTQHVRAQADHHDELGEESAGSAPPAFVRRPTGHRKKNARKNHGHEKTEQSTRGDPIPSPRRLMPYNLSSVVPASSTKTIKIEPSPASKNKEVKKEHIKNDARTSKPIVFFENEAFDDGAPKEIDFLGDIKKDSKTTIPKPAVPGKVETLPRTRQVGKLPVKQLEQEPTRITLTESKDKIDVVIDGAALLEKAQKAASDTESMDNIEKDDYPVEMARGAHASPCPTGELRCVDGHCITLAQLCDGSLDCSDHADEDNCYT